MTSNPEAAKSRSTSGSNTAMRMAVFSCVAAFGGPALAWGGILPAELGLAALGVGAAAGGCAMGLGFARAAGGQRGRGIATALAGSPAVFAVTALLLLGGCAPLINDISTDLSEPPGFVHARTLPENAGRSLDFDGASVATHQEGYPDLAPLLLPLPESEAFALAERTAREMPRWEVTHRDDAAHTLEAVASTALFQFRDDIVIRVRGEGDGESRIDMRSKSRVGKGDLGANAKRIRAYFEQVRRSAAKP